MITALAFNRVEFVKLFLKYAISLPKIMKSGVLRNLYGYCMMSPNSILDLEVRHKVIGLSDTDEDHSKLFKCLWNDAGYEKPCGVEISVIHNILNDLCGDIRQGNPLLSDVCKIFLLQKNK